MKDLATFESGSVHLMTRPEAEGVAETLNDLSRDSDDEAVEYEVYAVLRWLSDAEFMERATLSNKASLATPEEEVVAIACYTKASAFTGFLTGKGWRPLNHRLAPRIVNLNF